MRRVCFSIFFFIVALIVRADFNTPDFAFPKTVSDDAEKVLFTSNSGLTRLKAVMEIVKAKTDINPDSINSMPAFIGQWAEKEPNGPVRGLYMLFEAQVARMARRELRDSVQALVDRALNGIESWGDAPLSDFSEVIEIKDDSKVFFPKIRDFFYLKVVDLCPEKAENTPVENFTEGTPEWAYWICESDLSADDLLGYYGKYNKGVTGAYLLWKLSARNVNDYDRLLQNYLADNTRNAVTPVLENLLWSRRAPYMWVESPDATAPGKEFDIKVVYGYTSQVGIDVFRVNGAYENKPQLRKIATYSVDTDSTVAKDSTVFKITIPRVGNFRIMGFSKDIEAGYNPSSDITVTRWIPFGMVLDDKFAVGVADYDNGQPESGVNVMLKAPYKTKENPLQGVSSHDGFAVFSVNDKNKDSKGGMITLSKGSEQVRFPEWLSAETWTQSGTSVEGAVFVSRPLYHPGDTLGWSAVMSEKNYSKYSASLMAEKPFSAVLFDSNYTPVDTLDVVSDSFGRISGKFVIPADRLAGRYQIRILNGKRYVCAGSIMVSDFKMPVFEVKDLNVERIDSVYVVKGRAVRYTGASVPNARVEIVLRQARLWWAWFSYNYVPEVTAEGVTEADGSFSVSIPVTGKIPENGINYDCEVTVTSINADIASASTRFRVGKPYLLGGYLADNEVDGANPVRIQLSSVGTNLKFSPIDLIWTLSQGGVEKYSGNCVSDSLGVMLDWTGVIAGKYELNACPADTSLCNSVMLGNIWIYNTEKNELPADLSLVVPETTYKDVDGEYVEIFFGVGKDAYVYTIGCGKVGPAVNVKKYAAGFHKVRIPIDKRNSQQVALYTVSNGATYESRVRVTRPAPDRTLTLRGESWRDRLTPGAGERWTLRLADKTGKGAQAALIATLYNAALDALATNMQWPSLEYVLSVPQKTIRQNYVKVSFGKTSFNIKDSRPVKYFAIDEPRFMYIPDVVGQVLYYSSPRMSRAEKTMMAVNDMAEEVAVDEEVATAGSVSEPTPEPSDESIYRDAQTLQAFWMPELSTNSEGEAVITFTMPNAIGSWDFRASAWTKDFRTASMFTKLVSSKPVIVEPSLPRFLRQGDSARIGATVINNSDSAANIATIVDIFNPVDQKIISSSTFASYLKGGEQTVVYVDVDANVGLNSLGYRVRSGNGEFSDGEQAEIPVLESVTTVIDSELFYLGENQSTFTTTIPADKSGDGIVAIEYCQNPVWDAVKALPGLYDEEPKTALGAASAVYAALTAKYLHDKYPEISEVLAVWKGNPEDSALVSDLYKNQDIKLARLSRTPFVGAANANTEQMERFAATFDSKIIDKVLSVAVSKLVSLQRGNGGFSWGAWNNDESEWVSRYVLMTLSRVADTSLIYNDKTLAKVVDRTFGYIDRNVSGKTYDYAYALIYSRFSDRKPSTQSGVQTIDITVQHILKNWKDHTTGQKADDALILNSFGSVSSAKKIMTSIEQFAQTSPRKGVVFPSVNSVDTYTSLINAFSRLEPGSKYLDGMRKWLVLQTQTTDNLGAWNPTAVVAALISTGSRWTSNPSSLTAGVDINGTPLKINKVEAATGAFIRRLEPSSSSRAITFTCPDGTVAAYGSVISVSSIPLDEVKPRSCDELSIKKTLLANRNGKWVETDVFILGERVKVEMTVESKSTLDYVMISDRRPAGIEPVEQMPGWTNAGGLFAYREVNDTETNLFVNSLRPGVYYISYEAVAAYGGVFASGAATIQSQYAPEITARSGAERLKIE